MDVLNLAIPDVKLIKPQRFGDERGYFAQTYHQKDYAQAGIDANFVQDNHSRSDHAVLRGMHYQLKNPQAKLVSVIEGAVYDVAVDLRRSSKYFGQWIGSKLTADNGHQMFIPRGFAHGFLVLSEAASFCYKCDNFYTPGDEFSLCWNDPDVGIVWPGNSPAALSSKDIDAPKLKNISAKHLFA